VFLACSPAALSCSVDVAGWRSVTAVVRLPVGFRELEVMGADQAAAIGATQRDFGAAV
jgi:hypothetical protein